MEWIKAFGFPLVSVLGVRLGHLNKKVSFRLGALIKYKEGPPPYNVLVRDNRVADVDLGIVSNVQVSDLGSAKAAPIRGCRFEGNIVSDAATAAFQMSNLGYSTFSGNRATGGSGRIRFSRCEHVGREANGLD